MKTICEEKTCTGCMACYNICPKKCITMKYNRFEEISPNINQNKCIDCGLCKKVCPNNQKIEYNKPIKVYASWSKENDDRETSTSGGLASIFYQKAINDDFIVFGTSFDNELKLEYSYTTSKDEIKKYKGSKYCQSNIKDSYIKIKEFLKSGKKVLFVGTPCQIQGLKSFLKISNIEDSNLIVIDLVCHGVPSQKIFRDYIKNIEKNKKQKANKVTFRDNEKYMMKVYKDSKIIYKKDGSLDLYIIAFMNSMLQRESCLFCKYAKQERVSDITLGDFWKVATNNKITEQDREKGISLVLINTKKGEDFFEKCKKYVFYQERKIEEAVKGNPHLWRTSAINEKRIEFRKLYNQEELMKSLRRILKNDIRKNIKQYYKGKIKIVIKKMYNTIYRKNKVTI